MQGARTGPIEVEIFQDEQTFDVAIIGGGPAGLLLASKLGREVSTALIERSQLVRTTKYWVSTRRRLDSHDLGHCAAPTSGRLVVGTFLGSEVLATGDLAVVDEDRLLEELSRRCAHEGVQVREDCELLSMRRSQESTLLVTTQGDLRCRLVVDATGGGSPIASTFRMHRLDGFFSVYGVHLTKLEFRRRDTILAYVLRLGHPPEFVEVVPTGADSAFFALLQATRRLLPRELLAGRLESYLLHNPFVMLTPETRRGREKYGAIPIGRTHRRRIPGLFAFGEAGMLQPPLLGTAFNEVLEHVDLVAHSIRGAAARQSDGILDVRVRYPFLKWANDRVQAVLARRLLAGNVETVDRLAAALAKLPPELVFRIYSNELSWSDLSRLAPISPRLLYGARTVAT